MIGFVMFYAFFIFLLYSHTFLKPMSKIRESYAELEKKLEELEDMSVSRSTMIKIIKTISILIVVFYIVFYIIAASILNQILFTLVTAIFIVISFKSIFDYFDIINGKRKFKLNWYQKLNSLAGLIYTIYFMFKYSSIHYENYVQIYIGVAIAICLVILLKRNSQNQKRKREKEEEEETL